MWHMTLQKIKLLFNWLRLLLLTLLYLISNYINNEVLGGTPNSMYNICLIINKLLILVFFMFVIISCVFTFFSDVPELLVLEAIEKTKRFSSIYLTQCEAIWSQESETTYQIAKTIVLYILPLLFMSVAYYQIVRVLWKSDNIPGHTETVQMFNANTYNGIFTVGIQQSQATALVSNLSHWLCYANSAVNPLIYNFMSGKYRNEFKRLFLCWGSNRQNRLRRGAHTSRSGTYICRFTMTTMKADNVSFGLSPEDIQ
ncbi:hypothetical protein QTP88_024906 [Uroleucon formosanum]